MSINRLEIGDTSDERRIDAHAHVLEQGFKRSLDVSNASSPSGPSILGRFEAYLSST